MARRHLAPFVALALCTATPPIRALNGTGNNVANGQLGGAGTPYIGGGLYADAGSSVVSSRIGRLPSARNVSVAVFTPDAPFSYSRFGFSSLLTAWGQVIAHDFGFAVPGSALSDSNVSIPVPRCDAVFDPGCTGSQVLPFTRTAAVSGAVPRRQINGVSHFLDGSVVYGTDAARCAALREGRGGRMLLDADGNAPLNVAPSGSDGNPHVPASSLRSFGDLRGNIDPGTVAIHTALLREHNWQANATAAAHPDWDDESVFQAARAWVIAEMQAVTYGEYAAAVLGSPLAPYTGYNASIDPSVSGEFAAAAFRFAHSGANSVYGCVEADGSECAQGPALLRDSYFNPAAYLLGNGSVNGLVRGMFAQAEAGIDLQFVADVQSLLFHARVDLVALDIMRGRDWGLASYAQAVAAFRPGAPAVTSFAAITADAGLQARLAAVYASPADVDLYVGGMAECAAVATAATGGGTGGVLGPTFEAIIRDQLQRSRDGDRLYFDSAAFVDASGAPGFTAEERATLRGTHLGDILARTTQFGAALNGASVMRVGSPAAFAVSASSGCAASASSSSSHAEAAGTPSAELSSAVSVAWTRPEASSTSLSLTFTVSASVVSGGGWVGFGFGESMLSAQIALITMASAPGAAAVADVAASNGYAPLSPTGLTRYRVVGGSEHAAASDGGARVVSISRPIASFAGGLAFFEHGPVHVVCAWGAGGPAYHGANRVAGRLDFASGEGAFEAEDPDEHLRAELRLHMGFHAVALTFCFGILAPIGIVAARFCRHRPHISHLHGTTMSITGELVLAAGTVALFQASATPLFYTHRAIGILVGALVIATILLAVVFARMRASKSMASRFWTYLRALHAIIGWSVLLLGWFNILNGLWQLWPRFFIPFCVWIGAVIVAFLAAEAYSLSQQQLPEGVAACLARCRRCTRIGAPVAPDLTGALDLMEKDGGTVASPPSGSPQAHVVVTTSVSDGSSVASDFRHVAAALASPDGSAPPLPVMDCSSLAQRNDAHASVCLVVVGGFVLDVTAFLEDHPGGAALVYTHRGTDITRFFPDHGSPEAIAAHKRGHHVHSTQAVALLAAYRIGVAVGQPAAPAQQPVADAADPDAEPDVHGRRLSRLRCVSVTPEDAAGLVKTFAFEAPRGFSYVAGQHATFIFTCDAGGAPAGDGCSKRGRAATGEGDAAGAAPAGTLARRSWTISMHPSFAAGRIVISVKRVGRISGWLHDAMQPGTGSIELESAQGSFTPRLTRGNGRPVLLIAAGIGITPFRAMIPDLIAPGLPPVALVYSVRSLDEAVFVPELLAALGPSRCLVTATGEPAGSAWEGRRGRVDAALLRAAAPGGNVAACDVFLCGPEAFMGAVRAALVGLGHAPARCFSESFD